MRPNCEACSSQRLHLYLDEVYSDSVFLWVDLPKYLNIECISYKVRSQLESNKVLICSKVLKIRQ